MSILKWLAKWAEKQRNQLRALRGVEDSVGRLQSAPHPAAALRRHRGQPRPDAVYPGALRRRASQACPGPVVVDDGRWTAEGDPQPAAFRDEETPVKNPESLGESPAYRALQADPQHQS
jgi:hypothetical protein